MIHSVTEMSRAVRRRLERVVKKSGEKDYARRALALLHLWETGGNVAESAHRVRAARSSVYRWESSYETYGEEGIEPQSRGRVDWKASEELLKELETIVGEEPRELGYLRSRWSSELLSIELAKRTGVQVHATTVRRWLKRLEYGYRRARPTLHRRDPRKAERMQAIEAALADEDRYTEVFYVDEADVDLNPRIGSGWMRRGEQTAVPTPGQNQKHYIAGALHAHTGRLVWVEHERKTSVLFVKLLEALRGQYRRAKRIVLILDNYKIHKSQMVERWLVKNVKFRLLFQPVYHPWVNVIERLWKAMHDMKFGIRLGADAAPAELIEMSRLVEDLGFDHAWVADERFERDVFVNMTLIACHTTRLTVGCMVTDPFVRHPALTAAAAASVDDVSAGRCILGLGAGVSGFHEMGITRVRPARAIKEAIELIHRLTRGERHVELDGELIRFRSGHLSFTPACQVQIYVAGRGPRVLQAGGEVADGVVVASYASDRTISWGLEQVAIGAARSDRDFADLDKVSWLYTSISPDRKLARDAVRTGVAVAMWGSRDILAKIGVELPASALRYMDEHTYSSAPEIISGLARLIPDELLDEFSVAGTAEEVTTELIRIARLGINQAALWLFPPQGGDMEGLLRCLAERVIPRVADALDQPP